MSNNKTPKEILATYDRQIRKDMGFWIKYRPSRWGVLIPEKSLRPFIKFIKTKGGKKFVLISALIFSLLFVGVIPTLNFIWSNIFRLWLILLVIPLLYWAFAITSVYARVIIQVFCKFIRFIFYKLIDR
tara:strand:+ start:1194 stop:1580 length:387 start_codon:yes stop_codon:yes gene_type:complete